MADTARIDDHMPEDLRERAAEGQPSDQQEGRWRRVHQDRKGELHPTHRSQPAPGQNVAFAVKTNDRPGSNSGVTFPNSLP